ncbi:hypothetical protein [Natrarchaeobaculum sulfurireducens]|uniref:Uncharacterized protein n=1 Tax=Natrarchaeobaculum sulfurireducens TaxID=2044521 RepID=A0A346PSE2_9EURY|nr:hypothetical protein [Natrarchaeobaculum sulfurireducens]AXR82437.1 hypothetical protein AArcMg_2445 [Natrarchaeobaculum sulfurireducens]
MRRPTRRLLLATTGGLAVAGCLDDPSDATDASDQSADEDGIDPNESDDTDEPGDASDEPDDDRSLPPAGTFPDECPDYDNVDLIVAYDGIDHEETAIYLEPSTGTIAEGDSITFELQNESDRRFSHNQYQWLLHKRMGGDWYYIAPSEWPEPLHELPPGESYSWDLSVDNEDIEGGRSVSDPQEKGRDPIRGLGGGEYAFGTRGWFEDESNEEAIGFCARFSLEANALELTPTDEVDDTEWEDDVLVARSARGDPDSDSSRLGAYELERTDDDVDAESMITETVLRNDRLRDVIALARKYDADQVRLEEYDATTPIFGSREDGAYEYDGQTYEISTRELEESE